LVREIGPEPDLPKPINRRSVIDKDEILQTVTILREKYQGRELDDKLAEYILLTAVEVLLVKDDNPDILHRLNLDKIETIRDLTSGL
jgi:hypothetical protein